MQLQCNNQEIGDWRTEKARFSCSVHLRISQLPESLLQFLYQYVRNYCKGSGMEWNKNQNRCRQRPAKVYLWSSVNSCSCYIILFIPCKSFWASFERLLRCSLSPIGTRDESNSSLRYAAMATANFWRWGCARFFRMLVSFVSSLGPRSSFVKNVCHSNFSLSLVTASNWAACKNS